MGGFETLFSSLGAIQQGVQLVTSTLKSESSAQDERRGQEIALRQLQQRQGLNQQQAAQKAALERERIALDSKAAEEDRQSALRRAVARQRANFGAQGVSGNGGSSQAILLGLFDESEEDLSQRARLDDLRNRSINLGLSNSNSLNVLQRTQLQERQRVGLASNAIDRTENFIDFGFGALDTIGQFSDEE